MAGKKDAEIKMLRELVRNLADSEPCSHFDHHGNCQTHAWFDEHDSRETCPHGRAHRLGLIHSVND